MLAEAVNRICTNLLQRRAKDSDELLCPWCEKWSPLATWTFGTAYCSDCQDDHDTMHCPECGEDTDTIWPEGGPMQVREVESGKG